MLNKGLAKPISELSVLVTGGAGFIGSHTCVELIKVGCSVIIVDDLSNSNERTINRIRTITKVDDNRLVFIKCSLLEYDKLNNIFSDYGIDAILHFAGFKSVSESIDNPLQYYRNNVLGTINLCEIAASHNVKNIVFSSSATVYGDAESVPVTEACPHGKPTNPYGRTKQMCEQILRDLYVSDSSWSIVLLRYFNPTGAHESGLLGEDPCGTPSNLIPYVAQVAARLQGSVKVYGSNYETPDGTGVRDYIHVVDLAKGHIKALDWMGGKCGCGREIGCDGILGEQGQDGTRHGVAVFNLGTGKGSSVLEVVAAYEKACGRDIPYQLAERRPGDIAMSYASCEAAKTELDWSAEYSLDRMCEDSWRLQLRTLSDNEESINPS